METISVDKLAIGTLRQLNVDISNELKGDCVFIKSVFDAPLDNKFRYIIQRIKQKKPEQQNLIVILETNGGRMEIVERLVSVMRKHYDHVSFIIPDFAYSAGTVLALSGDRIYMDDYSVLGPIDPQFGQVPGYGYLEKYRELKETINKAQNPADVSAERFYLVNNFNPGFLFLIEQAIEHGRNMIIEWLPKYKFKNWQKTQTSGKTVTLRMKKYRARKIATTLGDAKKWHSHGRGIGMEDLRGEDIKLLIDDFGKDKKLNTLIRNYYGLAIDYTSRLGVNNFILHQNGMQRVKI